MMTMRLVMPFDHVPAAYDGGVNVSTYTDYPAFQFGTNGGASRGVLADSGYNWLSVKIAGANGYGYAGFLALPVSSLFDLTKARSYVGFRYKVTTYNTTAGLSAFCWEATTAPPGNGATGTTNALIKTTEFTFTLGQDYYIEIMFDWVNLTRTVWVDGVKIVNAVALGFTPLSTHLVEWTIQSGGSAVNPVIQVKDFYALDDAGDGAADSQRQGPMVYLPLTMNDASGNGWTSSDSTTLLADINTAITGSGNLAAPYAQSPTDGTPLDMHFNASGLDPNVGIKGLVVLGSAARPSGAIASVKTVMTDQATPANTKRLADQTFSSANVVPNRTIGVLTTALDGSTWTPTKIQQAKISMNAVVPGT
jgi:hypothetical protein